MNALFVREVSIAGQEGLVKLGWVMLPREYEVHPHAMLAYTTFVLMEAFQRAHGADDWVLQQVRRASALLRYGDHSGHNQPETTLLTPEVRRLLANNPLVYHTCAGRLQTSIHER